MPVIEVTNLRKLYRDKVAVEDVSFTVEKGEIFGILGPTGRGRPPPSNASPACATRTAGRSGSSAWTRPATGAACTARWASSCRRASCQNG
nr:hypothetical protein GCM10010200_019510 [Actinomadura rugatobispora]